MNIEYPSWVSPHSIFAIVTITGWRLLFLLWYLRRKDELYIARGTVTSGSANKLIHFDRPDVLRAALKGTYARIYPLLPLLVVFANGQSQRPCARTSNEPVSHDSNRWTDPDTGSIHRARCSSVIGAGVNNERRSILIRPRGLAALEAVGAGSQRPLYSRFTAATTSSSLKNVDVRQINATVEIEHAPVSLALALNVASTVSKFEQDSREPGSRGRTPTDRTQF